MEGTATISPLHSTMFLLKPKLHKDIRHANYYFTFHNVSIKTLTFVLMAASMSSFTFHNVSIKTDSKLDNRSSSSSFTFHNVSIKTWKSLRTLRYLPLYIPQCFY